MQFQKSDTVYMTRLFEVKDKFNRTIYLSNERWKHITTRHPEVTDIEEIREVILNPLIVKQDKFDEFLNYYYRFNKSKKRYLMVAVKYLNGEGFILTSVYTKTIKK